MCIYFYVMGAEFYATAFRPTRLENLTCLLALNCALAFIVRKRHSTTNKYDFNGQIMAVWFAIEFPYIPFINLKQVNATEPSPLIFWACRVWKRGKAKEPHFRGSMLLFIPWFHFPSSGLTNVCFRIALFWFYCVT